ncbi:MAG: hypothetical protein ABI846_06605 [Rudaea sp.]
MFALLVMLDILALVSLFATPVVLFVSLFFNDSPNANQILVWLLPLIFWMVPLTAASGGVMGLRAARSRNIRAMAIWTAVAYTSPMARCLVWVVVSALGA